MFPNWIFGRSSIWLNLKLWFEFGLNKSLSLSVPEQPWNLTFFWMKQLHKILTYFISWDHHQRPKVIHGRKNLDCSNQFWMKIWTSARVSFINSRTPLASSRLAQYRELCGILCFILHAILINNTCQRALCSSFCHREISTLTNYPHNMNSVWYTRYVQCVLACDAFVQALSLMTGINVSHFEKQNELLYLAMDLGGDVAQIHHCNILVRFLCKTKPIKSGKNENLALCRSRFLVFSRCFFFYLFLGNRKSFKNFPKICQTTIWNALHNWEHADT